MEKGKGSTQFQVVFLPSGHRATFPKGTSLLSAARSLGVDIDSVCGMRGLCGRCQVVCVEGEYPKHQLRTSKAHLSDLNAIEKAYSQRNKLVLGVDRRLSCQALIEGDLIIEVPTESQLHRQIIRKQAGTEELTLNPSVHLYYVDVDKPDLHNSSGDLQRLYTALEREWNLTELRCFWPLVSSVQEILRSGDWKVTVAVYTQKVQEQWQATIIALWPGYKDSFYGIAVDLGSTSIAVHLCDMSSGKVSATETLMNPQIRFGEDLMSRVSYAMMYPEGAERMTEVVREGINQLIDRLIADEGCRREDILQAVLVGNPIMHHLFLGISPIELGTAPFALATEQALTVSASDLGIAINPGAMLYLPPCIAGHVGADTSAMILAQKPYLKDEVVLLVDIGTNAEIVLGNRHRLLACSSPTGPAFEGAQISCGQRASSGAIERVRIDPKTLDSRFKVIGSELWSNQDGFEQSLATIGVNGICGSGIIELVAEMFTAGIIDANGVIDGTLSKRNSRIIADGRTFSYVLHADKSNTSRCIRITQNDVRQIQLAKAALYAGIKLLMAEMKLKTIDRICLAGAFGNQINAVHAMLLGLIPDCPLDQVVAIGNAAGTGALVALYDRDAGPAIEAVVPQIEKIETAIEPRFQQYFVDAMRFPHKEDEFPNLFSVVARPVPKEHSKRQGRRGRGRRTD